MAKELEEPLAALIISSARHSAMVFTLRKDARHQCKQVDRLVETAEGDVHGLAADDAGRADAGGVLAGAGVDDGVDDDLDGVLVGEEVDDLEGGLHDLDREHLLARVASVEHEGAHHALHDGAVGLAEALRGVAARRVREEHLRGVHGGDVVREGEVVHLEVLVGPLAEKDGRCWVLRTHVANERR